MNLANQILTEVKKAVVGKDEVLEKILMVILSKGHILLEDIPGVGKTTIAVAFSKAMSLETRRIQFTVDVLPSDVVGFTSIDHETGKLRLHPGAVFCNIFLADEINRTSSKTQAALLEVMEEGNITVDGYTQKAKDPFCVIATQNPFGSAGTQLLPESQLDRFMIRLSIGYPSLADEKNILKRKSERDPMLEVHAAASREDIIQMSKEVEQVYVHEDILDYIVALIDATRHHTSILQGASPRASISLMQLSKANAYLHDRDYVVPKDVQDIFFDVIGHRVIMGTSASETKDVLMGILHETKIKKSK
ncbi:AAA family ATPase [Amedibacillus hominis]|uniref:MoxR family ATPase n=1 Tax=Amedibacillus hominis TaxID=2897776 RepID=A0ABS9RCN4_9FIRM|nr:MoxR family ATPase [Amedibacillus hominis]MCH4287407.1 MoxR family ATPase [Amedibacillus hominis]